MATKSQRRQARKYSRMILLDSNILIYSGDKKYGFLRELFLKKDVAVSAISKLEVLGYHKITRSQILYFQAIFGIVKVIPIDNYLLEAAITYRRRFSMSVGDSIIAATAKIKDCILYTNNVADFKRIKDF